jgi:hypothetical protein
LVSIDNKHLDDLTWKLREFRSQLEPGTPGALIPKAV